jgi:hypothetical protein
MNVLDVKMFFNTDDVRANIASVNKMMEETFANLEKRINKVSKNISDRIAVTKTELAAASNYVSKAFTTATDPFTATALAITIGSFILDLISFYLALKKEAKDTGKEISKSAKDAGKDVEDVMAALELKMKQGCETAKLLHDEILRISKEKTFGTPKPVKFGIYRPDIMIENREGKSIRRAYF